jgi:hypothetical protein
MIRYSIITFIILFAGFNIYLRVGHKEFSTPQYQYQGNVMGAQKYIYGAKLPESVMIGTSLSAVMPMDSLQEIYKLSMPGLSMMDGMEILKRRSDYPKRVFIEINFFLKPETASFQALFSSSLNNKIKVELPAMKEENQPVSILMDRLRSRHKPVAVAPVENDTVARDVFESLLEEQFKAYTVSIDSNQLNNSLKKMEEDVTFLVSQGSEVCFFEMPVDSSLERLPRTHAIRSAITNRFKGRPHIYYIPVPEGTFRTKDGIHLIEKEAWRFASYFKKEADSIQWQQ